MFIKIGIFIGIMLLVLLASVKKITDNRDLKRRIEAIQRRKFQNSAPKTIKEMSLRRRKTDTKGFANILLKPLPDSKRMAVLLENAGVKMTPKQFILRRVIITCAIIIVIKIVLNKSILIALPVALIIGVWLPFKLLKRKINKQAQAFLRSFPEAIDLIVRGLRSGLPVSESVVQVSTELPEPISSVFTNIANTMKLGVPLEKALMETAKKLELREFHFFTTSIILQRETGGNLGEILNNLSEVLRSRFMMKMKIHAITSEARASAVIIGSLPFIVSGAVMTLSPKYLMPLIDEPGGNQALMVAIGMLGFGLWSMNRMAKFEI
jgi:tight adherence protein B